MPTRRPGHAFEGDLRRALLDATLRLLAEGSDPSLRAVARHTGVAASAVYHHFPNKTALLASVAAEGFADLQATLLPTAELPPVQALHERVVRYVLFAAAHAEHYRVMFDARIAVGSHPTLDQCARDAFAELVHAVTRVAGPESAVPCAVDVWAMTHGQVMLHLDGLIGQLIHGDTTEALARRAGDAAIRLVNT